MLVPWSLCAPPLPSLVFAARGVVAAVPLDFRLGGGVHFEPGPRSEDIGGQCGDGFVRDGLVVGFVAPDFAHAPDEVLGAKRSVGDGVDRR